MLGLDHQRNTAYLRLIYDTPDTRFSEVTDGAMDERTDRQCCLDASKNLAIGPLPSLGMEQRTFYLLANASGRTDALCGGSDSVYDCMIEQPIAYH